MAKGTLAVALAGGILALGAAGSAQAEPFREVKYLGGLAKVGKKAGVLSLEGGELRFHDRHGRLVFARPVAAAQVWIAPEKRTSGGCILKGIALVPVIAPLSAGMADPWEGCSGARPVVVVSLGGDTLRFAAPKGREQAMLDAIRNAAHAEAGPPSTPTTSSDALLSRQ